MRTLVKTACAIFLIHSHCYSSDLLTELEAAPPWSAVTQNTMTEKGSQLTNVIRRFKHLDEASVRNIVSQLLVKHTDTGPDDNVQNAWGKVFILNRYYFAVPPSENISTAYWCGGWMGIPSNDMFINLLWPWQENESGDLKLVGIMSGYMGRPYQGLEEFDYFSKRYGRRK